MARRMVSSPRFRVFGPLGVDSEDGPVDLGPPKQRAVLAILLLHADEIVPTDRIIDLVWGESPPRTAEHSVQIYISDLRKALSGGSRADVIATRPPGYVLHAPPDSVDILWFQGLVRDGLAALRAGDVVEGKSKLEHALETWTDAPLAEFTYEEFAQGYIRRLGELRADALEALAEVHLDQGDLDNARDLARRAIESDPMREGPRRIEMVALYRSGRQAEALRHYGDYHQLLAEELGIEPSEDLRQLEERVLLQDPSLDLQAPTLALGNPYRGLRAFSEEDAEVYFGRESLVAEVFDKLDGGSGFVSIVGPSGSGKSSAAQAGVSPVLRDRGESVVLFTPGPRPLWELARAMDRAGLGSAATLLGRFESDSTALATAVSQPVVLIIDQFEELFTLAEADTAARFSELVATAVEDKGAPLRVVATLRADYYDRPLSMSSLAGVFSDSIVSVKPMTAHEIERAVVDPARAAGVEVEPALLAQLVADMSGEPGALPLFQFTLFELFEQASDRLTLDDYQRMGGLQGALTRRADELLAELGAQGRYLVEQVMVRMIQKGRATSTSRPVLLRDLLDLDIDRVALQRVLEAFGSQRLLTFDRDASGGAVVEIAHDYLITGWPQLAAWIEEHSEDLDRLYALDAATEEWLGADRSEDYLLRGDRLKGFEDWRISTSLCLTKSEAAYLDESAELRDRPEPPPDVILWTPGVDGSLDHLVRGGFERAVAKHGAKARWYDTVDALHPSGDIESHLSRGTGLVLMMSLLVDAPDARRLIADYPQAKFAWIDQLPLLEKSRDNEIFLQSRHDEMGFLAGVVAAHKTEADHVGIVVGIDLPFMRPFHEGFQKGVNYVDRNIEVGAVYLSPGVPFSQDGFNSVHLGRLGAEVLISEGADVIFHAAGESGNGVFWAVHAEAVRSGRSLWVIGVDVDEHQKFEEWKSLPWASAFPLQGWQQHTLTSIVKRLDVVVEEAVDNYLTTGEVGHVELSITNGGIDYVTSGGHVDDIEPILEKAKKDSSDGAIKVAMTGLGDVRHLIDLVGP
jgi:basic membrane lipoprotein Med (substrate-binding protein (PBP1-ABC) superfamily)/DNA-binding SARP family transcriptional activator